MNTLFPAIPLGMRAVRYIGRRESWTDNLYDSGLTFVVGQVRTLPLDLANKLIRHRDMFEQVAAEFAPAEDARLDDTQHQLEQGKKDLAKKDTSKEEFAVIDQINQMDSKSLAHYALSKFGLKLDKRKNVTDLRQEVTRQIDRFGAV